MISGPNLLKSVILAASLAVLFGAGAVAAHAGEPKVEQCLDPAICPIPYVRLAKQATEPFLFQGKVVDENHPRYRHFGDAIHRFPDVRSCLVDSERAKPKPDLRWMDWGVVRNIADIDVCVFRIASSIEDVDTIKAWLRKNNFRVGRDIQIRRKDYVPKSKTEPTFSVESALPVEKFREIFPRPWLWKLFGIERVYIYSLGILFSRSRQVVGVSSNAVIE